MNSDDRKSCKDLNIAVAFNLHCLDEFECKVIKTTMNNMTF